LRAIFNLERLGKSSIPGFPFRFIALKPPSGIIISVYKDGSESPGFRAANADFFGARVLFPLHSASGAVLLPGFRVEKEIPVQGPRIRDNRIQEVRDETKGRRHYRRQ
jgi:hypothetical protein